MNGLLSISMVGFREIVYYSSCGLFNVMHEEQIIKNEDIGTINQDQINERKIKYKYSIMYFYTFN